ncbi:MAG: WbqC family protein [Candidatus Omnitrophica bacterium]|nr:WbqC family protein [Candidatus Omnitrophota bacterium]
MKKVAIIQSNYLPWKGYFDMIHRVDTFVFLDDVQYTTRDWRNRNKIKMSDGSAKWISVPVTGGRDQLICEAKIDYSSNWANKHLEALRHSYGETSHFDRYFPAIKEILEGSPELLSQLNRALVEKICGWLGIGTELRSSKEFGVPGSKDDKLIGIIREVGGDSYLSGPAARDYIVDEKFEKAGIGLEYMDYSHYPTYEQISEPFEHGVTILDLLFMVGEEAPKYIWAE